MNVLKRSASLVTAYLLAVSVFSASPISDIVRLTANAECQTIVNDTFWKDTNGNNIYSQGGGVFQFGDTYYWYGVHYIKDYGGAERQIALNNKIDSWQEVSLTDIQITNGKIQVGVYSDANAGNWVFFDDFSLVGNGNVQEPEPIPDGRFISSLNVNDSANRTKWSIQESLSSGDTVFGDRAFKFVDVPERLRGAEWIRSSCDSKKYADNEAVFTTTMDETIYIGLDSRITNIPVWLADWTKTDMTLSDDGNPVVTYNIYKKNYPAEIEVILGKIADSSVVNYVVIAKEQEQIKFIPGDIDNDERVNAFDIILMRRALIEPPTDEREKLAADMNGDGNINISDAVMMQRFLLGMD